MRISSSGISLLETAPAAHNTPALTLHESSSHSTEPMAPMAPMRMGDMEMKPGEMRMGNMRMSLHDQPNEAQPPVASEAPGEAPQVLPGEAPQVLEAPAEAQRERFCTRCGQKAEPEDVFCGSCGHKLRPRN